MRRHTDYQLAVSLMAAVYETTPYFHASIPLKRRCLGFVFAICLCGNGKMFLTFSFRKHLMKQVIFILYSQRPPDQALVISQPAVMSLTRRLLRLYVYNRFTEHY